MLADRGVEKGGTICQGVFLGGVDCYGWRKGEPGGWRKTLGKDIIGGKNEGQNYGEC